MIRRVPSWCRIGWLVALGVVLGACTDRRDAAYSNALATNLQSKGHLRTDFAPVDAPFTLDDLVRNFEQIVFRYEFHFNDGALVRKPLEKPIKRWRGRIRYALAGDAVTAEDKDQVADIAREISALTGLEFVPAEDEADMLITIADLDERDAISTALARRGLAIYRRQYETWRQTRSWICGATLSVDKANPDLLVHAHVFMAAELAQALRLSCLYEEIVQSLGLPNDSAEARPSIFNDDQEFARLTRHDAILLKTLYDPRLELGMTAAEAMPIAEKVLAENFDALAGPERPK